MNVCVVVRLLRWSNEGGLSFLVLQVIQYLQMFGYCKQPSLHTGSNMANTKDKELYKSKLSTVINCNLHMFMISL